MVCLCSTLRSHPVIQINANTAILQPKHYRNTFLLARPCPSFGIPWGAFGVENIRRGGNDLWFGFYAAEWNG